MLPTLLLCAVAALTPVDATPGVGVISLGRSAAFMEDASHALGVLDAASPARQQDYRRVEDDDPRFAFSDSAYWAHVVLKGGARDATWLLEMTHPRLDNVDVYVGPLDGRPPMHGGDGLRFSERVIPNRLPIFPILLPANQEVPLWIRVQGTSAMHLGMRLWEPAEFDAHESRMLFGFGLYYGLFLASALFSLLMYLVLRDRSHGWFALFVAALGLLDVVMAGFGSQYLWPDAPWLSRVAMPCSISVVCMAATRQTRHYVQTAINAPRHHRLLGWVARVAALWAVASLVVPYRVALWAALAVAAVSEMASLGAGWNAFKKRDEAAPAFLVASGVLLVGFVLAALRMVALIPSNLATHYGVQVGSVIMVGLFNLGLAQRIRSTEHARSLAQEEALEAQRSARVRVEALNAQLEARVAQRTQELEQRNQELASLNRRKDELVATVSHDFRSPLAVIRQNSQTLLRDLDRMDQEDMRDLLSGITRQEHRLTAMSTQLLDLARLKERGAQRAPVDLADVAQGYVMGMQERARAAHVSLTVDAPKPVAVRGDIGRLEQLIQNLVDNALKFTPQEGGVAVRVAQEDGWAVLQVQDTGPGIPADLSERIFEPFFQVASNTHAGQGSGLGLAIVKAVVDAHGGTVKVEPGPAGGARFLVRLPLLQVGQELAAV